jgi:gliding motility-associated-like protein
VYPPPYPNFTANPQITFFEQPNIDFYDLSVNAATWAWNFGDPASGINNYSSLPSPSHAYTAPGEYTVWLITTSPDGCIDSIPLQVRVLEIYDYFIPNTFTPDADGLNDVFEPLSASEMTYKLSIYDRWGEEIFVGENKGWDGKFNGKPVKSDVYVWSLLFRFKDYQQQIAYGHVTVLR